MTSIGNLYVPEKIIKENNYTMKYPNEVKSNSKFYNMFTKVEWANPICPLSCYDVEYEITYSFQEIDQEQSNAVSLALSKTKPISFALALRKILQILTFSILNFPFNILSFLILWKRNKHTHLKIFVRNWEDFWD